MLRPALRNAGAEMQISADGKFLYASNRLSRFNDKDPSKIDRLPGTIAVFAIDPQKHTLTEIRQFPRAELCRATLALIPPANTCSP